VTLDPERRGPGGAAYYRGIAESIIKVRHDTRIFTSWDQVAKAKGVNPAVASALQQRAYLGAFSVEGVENVGPQIGKELRRQGLLAVLLSLLGMLVYIWFRFELRFGIGAIMACVHDVIVTLGLFTLAGYEFNLTTVAAFLTLVGYSMNDTVVIFDRVRENLRKNRREPMIDVMNHSINQTLSRTVLTGGLTLLTVIALWYFGNETIKGFAFIMGVGILVGTYSSCYVASPFVLLWESYFGSQGKLRGEVAPASARGGSRPVASADETGRSEAPAAPRRTRSAQPARRRR
jgi:preprotein translocase subunit SecF